MNYSLKHLLIQIGNNVIKYVLALIVGLIYMSCESNPNEQTLWVNSAKVDCVGVGPMQCFQIKNDEDEPWSNFYQEISGFEFEPGYIYKLKVAVDTLDKKTLPADKSYLEYRLIKILAKETDPYLTLNDIWVVTGFHGIDNQIITAGSLPNIEINTRSMSFYGSDGCNQNKGKIETLSGNQIKFGPVMSTKKACLDMRVPNEFNSALSRVRYFERKNLELVFYDENNSKLLTFKKVD